MATTRIMPLHTGKGRTESQAVSDIIDYVSNPQKTDNGRLVTGFACDRQVADTEFLLAKRECISATGRVRGTDDVLAYHVRQSREEMRELLAAKANMDRLMGTGRNARMTGKRSMGRTADAPVFSYFLTAAGR